MYVYNLSRAATKATHACMCTTSLGSVVKTDEKRFSATSCSSKSSEHTPARQPVDRVYFLSPAPPSPPLPSVKASRKSSEMIRTSNTDRVIPAPPKTNSNAPFNRRREYYFYALRNFTLPLWYTLVKTFSPIFVLFACDRWESGRGRTINPTPPPPSSLTAGCLINPESTLSIIITHSRGAVAVRAV